MRPRPIPYTMALLDADGICTAQDPGAAADLNINGALASGGVATLDVARHVKINSTGNDTGRIFTITGTDRYGKVITENITGPNLAVGGESTKNFKTVTVVHIDGDPTGDITVGTNGKMEGPWLPVDYDREMTTVNVNVGGVSTIEHKVQHTVGNPFGANDALTAVDFYTAQTAEKTATVTQNIRAVRIVFTAFTGGTAVLTIMQTKC